LPTLTPAKPKKSRLLSDRVSHVEIGDAIAAGIGALRLRLDLP